MLVSSIVCLSSCSQNAFADHRIKRVISDRSVMYMVADDKEISKNDLDAKNMKLRDLWVSNGDRMWAVRACKNEELPIYLRQDEVSMSKSSCERYKIDTKDLRKPEETRLKTKCLCGYVERSDCTDKNFYKAGELLFVGGIEGLAKLGWEVEYRYVCRFAIDKVVDDIQRFWSKVLDSKDNPYFRINGSEVYDKSKEFERRLLATKGKFFSCHCYSMIDYSDIIFDMIGDLYHMYNRYNQGRDLLKEMENYA